MRYIYTVILFAFFASTSAFSQEVLYYFQEGFEVPEERALWVSTPPHAFINWDYQQGGDNGLPLYAYEGNMNAFFGWFDAGGPTYRTLESPPIDLSDARRPQLVFAHAQERMLTFQDEMSLMFKAGASAQWDTIEIYDFRIQNWTERTFNIVDYGSKYLVEDFQVGFLAAGNGGNGVVLDSIVIEETDIIPKFVRTTEILHVDHTIVPSGITDLPVMRIFMDVFGNTDTFVLNSVQFSSLGTTDTDFKTNGIKLYRTRNEVFKNEVNGESTQVGAAASVSSGTITFSGLNDTLFTGENYLWLTIDVNAGAVHNNLIDLAVSSNGISISDTVFPATQINPLGDYVIKESVLFDDFEASTGWSLGGDFEIATPQGFQINIATDPDIAYSGTNILGTDLTNDGGYEMGITAGTEYYAIAPSVNLKYYKDIQLYAHKWLSFNSNDEVDIEISTDGGASWKSIWNRKNDLITFNESGWTEFLLNEKIDNAVKLNEDVRVRLALNETSPSYVLGGWNIDNFAIVGNHLDVDVGITQIFSPYNDCLGTNNDSVKVIVRNYAEGPTPASIPIYYTLDGAEGQRFYDTIPGPIAQDDSTLFTFDIPVNFPGPGGYDFLVSVDLAGDEDAKNDTVSVPIYIQNSLNLPLEENFEIGSGYWIPSEESDWNCFIPSGGIPVLTASPNSWFVAPTGIYLNSDTTYIESNCYDFTSDDKYIIELKYWNESEAGADGANLEFTVDDGSTWSVVDSSTFGVYSGWYSENVSALGEIGWSGDSDGWITAREFVPSSLYVEPNVKFRIVWATSPSTSFGRGFIFDDFNVYKAPDDIGASAIINPTDACQLVNDGGISVEITNFGPNKLSTNDSIIVGVDVDGINTLVDTVILASELLPSQTMQIDLNTVIDLSVAKAYTIKAYTLNEANPYFYAATSNDTTEQVVTVWQNPTVIMADTIGSRQPDTVVVSPDYPDAHAGYSYLWTPAPGAVTTPTFHVLDDGFGAGVYTVRVTENVNNCETYDSVNVLLLYFDAGADSILSPNSSCELSGAESVEIRVRNMGTDSLLIGDKIEAFYQVNGGAVYTDTITLTDVLRANGTITHIFNETFDFSAISSYTIDAWAYYLGGDEDATNDAVSSSINNFGYTPLDIGEDQVVQSLDYTLDAGPGFVSYLWNNGDTTQTKYLDASVSNVSGTYFVDVLDANGCAGSDTIDIWFKIRDLRADMLTAPQTACELDRTGDGYVQFRVVNNGTDTVLMSDNITFEYLLDGGSVVTETTTPTNPILPGAQYSHTFATSNDFTAVTDYEIDLKVITAGDLRTANDTTSAIFTTKANPIIDLGVYPDPITSLSFELDAGAGPYTYQWQDGFTTSQTYTATATGYYSVVVTNTETGCIGGDTTLLQFDQLNYSIESISGVSNRICQGENRVVVVEVANKGNLPRIDAEITVGYINGSDSPVEELFTIDGSWSPGVANSKELTLSNAITFDNDGLNKLKVYVTHPEDLIASDDTLTEDLTVDASPVVDFGGDTLQVPIPHTLDAGDHDSYQWHDNFDGRYYTVTSADPDLYSVTVTDLNNSCITSKSVWIEPALSVYDRLPDNLSLNLYPNPASEFLNITAEDVTGEELFIEMYSITNQLIWADYHDGFGKYNHKLDLSSIKEGVYLLRFRNKELMHVQRVIIK